MAEYDDIELDEETLRKIEEEALLEAEAELAADQALLDEIETQALEDVGIDDIELDDEFLAELKLELASLSEEDLDIEEMGLEDFDFDLSEFDVADLQDEQAAAPPLANTDTGTVKRAQARARENVRKRMVEVAAEQIREHQKLPPKPISIEMMEADIANKSGTLKIALILMSILVLAGIAGAVAMIILRGGEGDLTPVSPVRVVKDRATGKILTPEEIKEKERKAEAYKLFKVVLNAGKRGHQTLDDLKQALANIETLRKDYPNFAKEQEVKIAEREEKIKSNLEFYQGTSPKPGSGK